MGDAVDSVFHVLRFKEQSLAFFELLLSRRICRQLRGDDSGSGFGSRARAWQRYELQINEHRRSEVEINLAGYRTITLLLNYDLIVIGLQILEVETTARISHRAGYLHPSASVQDDQNTSRTGGTLRNAKLASDFTWNTRRGWLLLAILRNRNRGTEQDNANEPELYTVTKTISHARAHRSANSRKKMGRADALPTQKSEV